MGVNERYDRLWLRGLCWVFGISLGRGWFRDGGAAGRVRVVAVGCVVLVSHAVRLKGLELRLEHLGIMKSDCGPAQCRSHVEPVIATAWDWEWPWRAVAVLKVHPFREHYIRVSSSVPRLRLYRRHFFFFGTRRGPRYSCIRGGDLGLSLGFFSSTGLRMEAALDA